MLKNTITQLKTFVHEYAVTLRQVHDDIDQWIEKDHATLYVLLLVPVTLLLGSLYFVLLLRV